MASSSDRPAWRTIYNSWEKAVGPGLEQLTGSNGFRDVLAVSARVNAELLAEMERASRRWLHLWNLPAASDVRSLRRQVAGLERELKALRRSTAGPDSPAARPLGIVAAEDPSPADLADAS